MTFNKCAGTHAASDHLWVQYFLCPACFDLERVQQANVHVCMRADKPQGDRCIAFGVKCRPFEIMASPMAKRNSSRTRISSIAGCSIQTRPTCDAHFMQWRKVATRGREAAPSSCKKHVRLHTSSENNGPYSVLQFCFRLHVVQAADTASCRPHWRDP